LAVTKTYKGKFAHLVPNV